MAAADKWVWVRDYTGENCHLDRLDIDDLSMITQSPAFNVWEAVCSFLGVSNDAIITAKESHLGNARREREAAFLECLKTWYIGKTDTHVCWEILLAAIAEAGEPAYVQQLWTDIDSRGYSGEQVAKGGMAHLYQTPTQLPRSCWPNPVIERGPVIHIIGGFTGCNAVNSAECYNDSHDVWEMDAIQPMKCSRSGFGVAEMHGLLFAVGGTVLGSNSSHVECYNPRQNRWYDVAPMISSRRSHGVAVVTGLEDNLTGASFSYIFSIGGEQMNVTLSSVERYNLWSNKWEEVAPLKIPKKNIGVGTVNSLVYVVGGSVPKEHEPHVHVEVKAVECYNPRANVWEEMPSKHHCCSCPGVAVLNDCLYVVGGYCEGHWVAQAECFNSVTKLWTVISSMTFPRTGIATATLKGEVYAIGGFNGVLEDAKLLKTVEKYNPAENTWKQVAPLHLPRTVAGVVVSHMWTVQQ